MCGIIGAVAQRNIVNILVDGLSRLEYRGYDSAGVAILGKANQLQRIRCLGKVQVLKESLDLQAINGNMGIAHTRWATHGEPSERNAHPHFAKDRVAVVHNGIIENHTQLKEQLAKAGYHFDSDTDSEVIAHLVHRELATTPDFLQAVKNSVAYLQGAYGAVLLDNNDPDRIIVARSGSPLVIGVGQGENFIASDQLALLPVTRKFIYLEEGDIAEITRDTVRIFNAQGEPCEREIQEATTELDAADKGPFEHYMQKEIYDQPRALQASIDQRVFSDKVAIEAFGPKARALLKDVRNIQILACGTSFHAGSVARYWLESLLGIPCQVEIASEFRYREPVIADQTLVVAISQSGETADTLAALRYAQQHGAYASLAICNVSGSSLVRETDMAFMTRAGIEIGVASTKAFTTQLSGLAQLTLALAQQSGRAVCEQKHKDMIAGLLELPAMIEQTLMLAPQIAQLADAFVDAEHCLFLGRGDCFPIAQEGALKLKEISYIHAEAYAAGELKHGPLALIDKTMPVIVVAPDDQWSDKLMSNIEEVKARGGKVIVFTHAHCKLESNHQQAVIHLPIAKHWLSPLLFTLPLQLLAYYVALARGTDIDQPRNLAKSVTVE